jgi:hypothetical protein
LPAARYGCVRVIFWISATVLGSRSSGLDVAQTVSLETVVYFICAAAHMKYTEVTLNDLQREFQQARLKPRHILPQPKTPSTHIRNGFNGVIDSLQAAHHALEMFRRTLPTGAALTSLDRLSNRLTKIVTLTRKLRSS